MKKMNLLFLGEDHSPLPGLAAQLALLYKNDQVAVFKYKKDSSECEKQIAEALVEMGRSYSREGVEVLKDLKEGSFDLIVVLCQCFRAKAMSFSGFPVVLFWPMGSGEKHLKANSSEDDELTPLAYDLELKLNHLFEDGYLEAYQRQGEQLKSIFNDPNSSNIKFDENETIKDVNLSVEKLTGFSRDEVLGEPLSFLFPPTSLKRYTNPILKKKVDFVKANLVLKNKSGGETEVDAVFKSYANVSDQAGLLFLQEKKKEVALPLEDGPQALNLENIEKTLAQTGGNRTKAAQLLGIGRATLYRFLDKTKRDREECV